MNLQQYQKVKDRLEALEEKVKALEALLTLPQVNKPGTLHLPQKERKN